MFPAPFIVVLDANVLFPFTLRDTLLRAAAAGFYQLRWSDRILDETLRNIVKSASVTAEGAERLRTAMMRAFPEALVSGYESFIDAMPNDPKDRHVAAAAVRGGAQVIVTENLRDFSSLPPGIEAQSADDFLCNLFDLDPTVFVRLVRSQASDMKRPPVSFEQLLDRLARTVPAFAAAVGSHARG